MTPVLRRRRLTLLAALVLCTLAFLPAVRADDPPQGRKYALLVGVRTYNKDQLRSLKYTENDVNDLAAVLKDAGYERVVLMTQSEAHERGDNDLSPTTKNVRRQLAAILDDRQPGDSVLVAFSGHGVQFRDDKASYFCPMDADLGDLKTLVSLADVYKGLDESKAGLKVLLVDACRNDPQAEASKSADKIKLESVTRPQAERPPGGVAALFSCSEGQKSYESEKLKHGVFFHYVIEGLKGKAPANKKGEIGLEGLSQYVKDKVPDAVTDVSLDARQRPQLVGDLSGSTPLATVKLAAPVAPAPAPGLLLDEDFQKVPAGNPLPAGWEGDNDVIVVTGKKSAARLEAGPGGQHKVRLPEQSIKGDFYLEWEYDIEGGGPKTHVQVRLDGAGGKAALIDIFGRPGGNADVSVLGKTKGVGIGPGKCKVRLERNGRRYTLSLNGDDPAVEMQAPAVDFDHITFAMFEDQLSKDTTYRIYAVRLGK